MYKKVSKLTIFLLSASLLLSGCKGKNQEAKQPELLHPVNESDNSEKVTYREIYSMQSYKAKVVPYTENLAFSNEGTFDKFHVIIGDKVKKGQELACQNSKQIEDELEQLQTNYEETRISLENEREKNALALKLIDAKLKIEEDTLKNAKAGAKDEITYTIDKLKLDKQNIQDNAKMSYIEHKDTLSECNTKMDILKDKLDSSSIVAPFDGIVKSVSNIEKGSMVSSLDPMIQIVDTTKSYIMSRTEKVYTIKKADRYYAFFGGKKYKLKYEDNKTVGASNNSGMNQYGDCKFTLKNKDDKLDFGECGILSLLFNYKDKALSITNKSLYLEGAGKYYVHRIRDGKKEKIYVEIGKQTDIYTEITKGLEEGDVVFNE